ncbi:MAG: hypothetical protein SP1CHLAM54_03670 [Chlamydiia bacterium]|nr:hypothetical protein [Chlamydiia bacterium]MCH9615283.1 hypothetical protein [Chlamydiia bacterium]MCH9628395.1 hypothetical protein [Chlamydiia bacterium]
MVNHVSGAASSIEHSAWIKSKNINVNDIPKGVNTVNIFAGSIGQVNGHWEVTGITQSNLDSYIKACRTQGITVKLTVGGQATDPWSSISQSNVEQMGTDLANYCQQVGVQGIDFDDEATQTPAQRALVGQLIGYFKKANPQLETSVCTLGGAGPKYPSHEADIKQILDGGCAVYGGKCPVDRLYVMSYDYTLGTSAQTLAGDEEFMQQWIAFGKTYGIDPAHISSGVNPPRINDLNAADKQKFIEWSAEQGLSTGVWTDWTAQSAPYTQEVSNWYNQA